MTITRQVKSAPAKRVAVRIGDLYPSIDARFTGMLPVPGGHTIYFEESGNPDGLPVVPVVAPLPHIDSFSTPINTG
jgi:hypothetical protein